MKKSKNTFKNEKNYKYWSEQFDGYGNYMMSGKGNEYYILRNIFFSFIDDDDSILDVGCASGGTYGQIKDQGRNNIYKGVDYAEGFVLANRKKFPEVKWSVMDARELKEAGGTWDVVLIYDVLDALEHWEEAIDEAIRVAVKKVVIMMWMDADMAGKRDYMRTKGLRVFEIDIEGDGIHYHKVLIGEK